MDIQILGRRIRASFAPTRVWSHAISHPPTSNVFFPITISFIEIKGGGNYAVGKRAMEG